VNRTEIQAGVLSALRESAIVGDDRTIGLGEPLAKLGAADSLSLVQLVTAIEVKFQAELPESIWMDREGLTLASLIDAVEKSGSNAAKPARPAPAPESGLPTQSEAAQSKLLKVAYALRERGVLGGTKWVLKRFRHYVEPLVCERIERVILECDLYPQFQPHVAAVPVEIRQAAAADVPALATFFALFGRRMAESFLHWRLLNGYTCFIAYHDRRIVGMTWDSVTGDHCFYTGLQFKMLPTTNYAFELYEHPGYGGKGVGLALLSHGLLAAKHRGFTKQVSWVDVSNTKMLSAAIHMFGFVKVGSVRTTRLLQRPSSTWEIGGRAGRGGVVEA
jgi:GNAT superfamily N-acetyltransferase/acyl carrier protein